MKEACWQEYTLLLGTQSDSQASNHKSLVTCGGFTGSLDNEETDATAFAEWGFDFVKEVKLCESNIF